MSTDGTVLTEGAEEPGRGFQTRLPSTKLGKWSMWLAVTFFIGFILNNAFVGIFGRSEGAMRRFSETYLPYWGIALFMVGFSAGVCGLIAILKYKERSVVNLLAIVPSVFVILFLLGEFLLPH